MDLDLWEKTINENFKGNVEEFKEAYAHAVAEGRLYAIQWKDLEISSTSLPELEQEAHDLIERRLGYLPHENINLRYEPFLRALIQEHRLGKLSDEAFSEQAEGHIKLIRNENLKHNACIKYDPRIYKNYERYLSDYRHKVKSRLTGFLGYEPQLDHSLMAEMWLCDIMAKDAFHLPPALTAVDFKAITVIKYREVLLEQGMEAANASPLWGKMPALL